MKEQESEIEALRKANHDAEEEVVNEYFILKDWSTFLLRGCTKPLTERGVGRGCQTRVSRVSI